MVVDEQIFMDKVLEIWETAEKTDRQIFNKFKVMLKRDLSDEESLIRSLGDEENSTHFVKVGSA